MYRPCLKVYLDAKGVPFEVCVLCVPGGTPAGLPTQGAQVSSDFGQNALHQRHSFHSEIVDTISPVLQLFFSFET